MCFKRAHLLVLTGKDQRGDVDLTKARAAVGAMNGDLRLLGQHVGACIEGHGANDVTQALIAEIGRRNQVRPGIEDKLLHAFRARPGNRSAAYGGVGNGVGPRRRVNKA